MNQVTENTNMVIINKPDSQYHGWTGKVVMVYYGGKYDILYIEMPNRKTLRVSSKFVEGYEATQEDK